MTYTPEQIQKRANTIPKEISFEDDNGNALADYGILRLTPQERYRVAEICLKQKQSWRTVILRSMSALANKTIKEHNERTK